jgi:hypothetical protein
MASFTTVLSEYSDTENRRTFAVAGHSVVAPKLLIQKRKAPRTAEASAESQLQVVFGTVDGAGNPLASKIAISADVRYPANGLMTDVAAALAVFRDLVNSDEFTNMVNSQTYVK